ncbi:MAG: hypothetical protein M3R15_04145 [Acidobacteriota bacterium]|nr:hypothetical protein [Acidobacteriota bacterium]
MKRIFAIAALALATTSPAFSQAVDKKPEPLGQADTTKRLPTGWYKAGSKPQNYDMGADATMHHGGKQGAYVKSIASADAEGFGTLMQTIKADDYRGKRIRLSGYAKTNNVEGSGQMWIRIDGEEGALLGFDNMDNRKIVGTTDWKKYELVLDVPENSVAIAFGFFVHGKGEMFADDLRLEVVEKDVATTNMEEEVKRAPKELEEHKRTHKEEFERRMEGMKKRLVSQPTQPVNLDFEMIR